MDRRSFIHMATGGTGILLTSGLPSPLLAATHVEKIVRTEAQWRKLLTPEQFYVLREEGTEVPFTSPLNEEHRAGTFGCVACDLELFPSKFKFDSGTGWPSFFDAIAGHLATKFDYALGMPRTEYHCARCGGHHGHVFNDGPRPTGLRYCGNGVALKFVLGPT